MRVRSVSVVAIVALLGAGAPARPVRAGGEPSPTAADATESGRKLDRALDVVLDASSRVPTGPRTLALVVDPSPALVAAGFADRLEAALARQAARLATTELLVGVVGGKDPVALAPTADAAAVVRAVRAALAGAKDAARNVFADLRGVAAAVAGRAGAREALLVTASNGDLEDDLEGTVKALERARVRCSVLTTEAFLSDSYWHSHPRTPSPRGTTWTGGDAAFAEVPWGFVLQRTSGNEEASSGFAPFGLSRLAAATGGRVFLHEDPTASSHRCTTTGWCRFCAGTGDHAPAGDAWQPSRVRALAPPVGPRDEVIAAAGKDPAYRVVLATWKQLADAGLVRSRPSLESQGGAWRAAKVTSGAVLPLVASGFGFSTGAARASKALEVLEKARADLDAALGKVPDDASPRYRAVAEYLKVMLLVTRANLIQYVAWCQDAGPALVGKTERAVEPPELPWRTSEDVRFVGISFTDIPLCHGAAPAKALFLPGGPALARALDDLDAGLKAYLARYGGTPFGVAARRAALSQFVPTVQGKVVPVPRTPNGGTGEPPTTTPDRPAREGGGGATSGPTTSGG